MISCIKLVTGEDIIGEMTMHDTGKVTVKNAFAVVMVPAAQNQYTVGLAPFLPFASTKEMTYNREHVVLMFEPVSELANDYRRITGGIILAKSELKLV